MKNKIKVFVYISLFLFAYSCNNNKENINKDASLTFLGELPENPLLLNPINFSINKKEHTMSTLYGNKTAFEFKKNNTTNLYPKGSVLYEVTWNQKDDDVWFGGKIPKNIKSIERIEFHDNPQPFYEYYIANPMRKVKLDSIKKYHNIKVITSQNLVDLP